MEKCSAGDRRVAGLYSYSFAGYHLGIPFGGAGILVNAIGSRCAGVGYLAWDSFKEIR